MPVERMRMRPWLEEQIDSCQIPGLKWVNKEERMFQIAWLHGAHQNWDLEKDAPLFMRWAIHTGKYRPEVDRPNPRMWKSNFRCALNSLTDVEEVKDQSVKRGSNAFRVYRMMLPKGNASKALKRVKRMDMEVLTSERFLPEDDQPNFTAPDRVKQEPSEETDCAEDGDVKAQPHDFPVKAEDEDLPCSVVTVRIGENGKVEETDEPVFRLDPRAHFKSFVQKVTARRVGAETLKLQFYNRSKRHTDQTGKALDRRRKKTPFRFENGET